MACSSASHSYQKPQQQQSPLPKQRIAPVAPTCVSTDTDEKKDEADQTDEALQSMESAMATCNRLYSALSAVKMVTPRSVTPIAYHLMESMLLEIYATCADVIKSYHAEPKTNAVVTVVDRMNEIIDAICGLFALSDAYYQVEEDRGASHSAFPGKEKTD